MTNKRLQMKRMNALILDGLICLMFLLFCSFVNHAMSLLDVHPIAKSIYYLSVDFLLVVLICSCGYLFNKNSFGKELVGIQVVSTNGSEYTLSQSIKRNLPFIVGIILLSVYSFLIRILEVVLLYTSSRGEIEEGRGCFTWVFIVALPAIFIVAYMSITLLATIIKIHTDPDGIRWGDRYAKTKVVLKEQ